MSAPNRQPFVKPGTAPATAASTMPTPTPKPSDPLAYLHGKKVCIKTRGVVRFVGTLFKSNGQFYTLRDTEEIDGETVRHWQELTHIDKACVMFVAEAN